MRGAQEREFALEICKDGSCLEHNTSFLCAFSFLAFTGENERGEVRGVIEFSLETGQAIEGTCVGTSCLANRLDIPTAKTDVGVAFVGFLNLNESQA